MTKRKYSSNLDFSAVFMHDFDFTTSKQIIFKIKFLRFSQTQPNPEPLIRTAFPLEC